MNISAVSHIFFDWGDTVMVDDPTAAAPMLDWEIVTAVEGIREVLARCKSAGKFVALATNAAVSEEDQIRMALARVGLDAYFERIYCFKNTGLAKSEAFYRRLLQDLNLHPEQALMIGDSFEKDVRQANLAGIPAIWFNPRTDESKSAPLHTTAHSMREIEKILAG